MIQMHGVLEFGIQGCSGRDFGLIRHLGFGAHSEKCVRYSGLDGFFHASAVT